MSVYFLEIYNDKSSKLPDFGLSFQDHEVLINFIERKFAPLKETLQKAIESKLSVGWTLSLNTEGTLRVSKIPMIKEYNDTKYDDYLSMKPYPQINNIQKEIKIPRRPKPEDKLTAEEIKEGNILVDFHDILKGPDNPIYLKRNSYEKLPDRRFNPWTRREIKGPIKTRKVKLL
jgi:hypothetical protein